LGKGNMHLSFSTAWNVLLVVAFHNQIFQEVYLNFQTIHVSDSPKSLR